MKRGADGDFRWMRGCDQASWTLKFYSANDGDACPACKHYYEKVVALKRVNLFPLDVCTNARCRNYFRPWWIGRGYLTLVNVICCGRINNV
jgi:hypothetical protein